MSGALTGYWENNQYYRSDGVVFIPVGPESDKMYRPLYPVTKANILSAIGAKP